MGTRLVETPHIKIKHVALSLNGNRALDPS